jgi:hypothetical protein
LDNLTATCLVEFLTSKALHALVSDLLLRDRVYLG